MTRYRSAIRAETLDTTIHDQAVVCPECSTQFMFSRSAVPRIDECGFETYRVECKECATVLAGIIDPADDALLISRTAI